MNAAEFRKLVTKHFSPLIRESGWKGSGFHFYRHDPNHIVNIFGIQGSWTGGSVCCETAIHFDFIPRLTPAIADLSKVTYASCMIRNRLSPRGGGDYQWKFSDDEDQNRKSVLEIWNAFRTDGVSFFNDFAAFPYPFDTILPDDLDNQQFRILGKYPICNPIAFALLLKEINLLIGRHEMAKQFADSGFLMAMRYAPINSWRAPKYKGKDMMGEYAMKYRTYFGLPH